MPEPLEAASVLGCYQALDSLERPFEQFWTVPFRLDTTLTEAMRQHLEGDTVGMHGALPVIPNPDSLMGAYVWRIVPPDTLEVLLHMHFFAHSFRVTAQSGGDFRGYLQYGTHGDSAAPAPQPATLRRVTCSGIERSSA
jgi:hypothetical protein